MLGLDEVPDSRRLCEYPSLFGAAEVAALEAVVQSMAREVVLVVIAHEVNSRGSLQVFTVYPHWGHGALRPGCLAP